MSMNHSSENRFVSILGVIRTWPVDMRAKLTDIDKYDAKKIWEVLKSTAVVQNLADDDESKLTKKLVLNRMAEAETDSKTKQRPYVGS